MEKMLFSQNNFMNNKKNTISYTMLNQIDYKRVPLENCTKIFSYV